MGLECGCSSVHLFLGAGSILAIGYSAFQMAYVSKEESFMIEYWYKGNFVYGTRVWVYRCFGLRLA